MTQGDGFDVNQSLYLVFCSDEPLSLGILISDLFYYVSFFNTVASRNHDSRQFFFMNHFQNCVLLM